METSSPAAVEPQTQSRAHHKFGPSRLEYLDHCAAFTNKSGQKTAASLEGDELHDVMAKTLKICAASLLQQPRRRALYVLDSVLETHEFSEDQTAWLRSACRTCDKILDLNPVEVLVEVEIKTAHPDGTELNHGFLDACFIFANGSALIVDFKFGWIPVPHARGNLQGTNYMLGIFQMRPDINRIGVKFVQPKLNLITEAIFDRSKMYEYYDRVRQVITTAEYVQTHPEDAQNFMSPGPYCDYCALAGSCTVLANHRAVAAAKMTSLPLPPSFQAMELRNPQDVALARYWCDVIEKGVEDLKKLATDFALANGNELRCTLPTGEEIVYEINERAMDRTLGAPAEIAEVLKEHVTLEQLIAVCDLPLGKVLKLGTEGMHANLKAGGQKATKKACEKAIENTLSANGLLTQPEGKIKYLKLKKQVPKELENTGTTVTE